MTEDFGPSLNLSRAAKNQFPGRGAQVEAFIRGARYASDQMEEILREVQRVLRPGSRAVVVIGDSVIGGRKIDNGDLIADVGQTAGFSTEFAGIREIATGKSSFNRAHSRGRRTEHILVLRSKG